MLSNDEIENWKKKYPFLETIIKECPNLFVIVEEPKTRNQGLDQCKTRGYDCTQGESTSWGWYGIRNGIVKELERGSLGEVMSKECFDYVITHENIITDTFNDDTIRIYRLRDDTVSKDIASTTKDFLNSSIGQDWVKRSREYGFWAELEED